MRHSFYEVLGWLVIILIALLMVNSCSLPTAWSGNVYQVAGLYQMDPPESYPQLMEMARECLRPEVNAKRKFEDVAFFWTTRIVWLQQPDRLTLGLYDNDKKRIVLLGSEVAGKRTPFHEMMHYLAPSLQHEDVPFARCDPFQGSEAYH